MEGRCGGCRGRHHHQHQLHSAGRERNRLLLQLPQSHAQPPRGSPLVRAFRVAMMPALATLIVCCSITSCSCSAVGGTRAERRNIWVRAQAHVADKGARCPFPTILWPTTPPCHPTPPCPTTTPHHAACRVRHLVKLVDAAHALVTQHQRAALQHHLLCLGVLLMSGWAGAGC